MRTGQHGWRATREPGKRGQRMAHPPFFGSSELLGQLRQMWKGSPETCEFALNRCQHPQRARVGSGQRRGAPTSPSQGQQQTPWGRNVLNCSSYDCQMLPVYGLTEFSTLNEKNLYQIKKMSNVNGSCTQMLVRQRLPLLAHPPNPKVTIKDLSRYHQDTT